MTEVSSPLVTITLNINGLNSPIKRQKIGQTNKKIYDPSIHCLQGIHFRSKNTNKLKTKEWKKIYKQ